MRKIGIIGLGHVGATVAVNIVQGGFADELILIDKKPEVAEAEAEAIDLQDSLALQAFHTKVYIGSYADLADADIALSTFVNIEALKTGGDRFTELRLNAEEIKQVSEDFNASGFKGILIATTNSNDVIVDMYAKYLNLPNQRILGTGTYLDTARMKRKVAGHLGLAPPFYRGLFAW